jgi:hypothetical protein
MSWLNMLLAPPAVSGAQGATVAQLSPAEPVHAHTAFYPMMRVRPQLAALCRLLRGASATVTRVTPGCATVTWVAQYAAPRPLGAERDDEALLDGGGGGGGGGGAAEPRAVGGARPAAGDGDGDVVVFETAAATAVAAAASTAALAPEALSAAPAADGASAAGGGGRLPPSRCEAAGLTALARFSHAWWCLGDLAVLPDGSAQPAVAEVVAMQTRLSVSWQDGRRTEGARRHIMRVGVV